jgi:hypothetical protein
MNPEECPLGLNYDFSNMADENQPFSKEIFEDPNNGTKYVIDFLSNYIHIKFKTYATYKISKTAAAWGIVDIENDFIIQFTLKRRGIEYNGSCNVAFGIVSSTQRYGIIVGVNPINENVHVQFNNYHTGIAVDKTIPENNEVIFKYYKSGGNVFYYIDDVLVGNQAFDYHVINPSNRICLLSVYGGFNGSTLHDEFWLSDLYAVSTTQNNICDGIPPAVYYIESTGSNTYPFDTREKAATSFYELFLALNDHLIYELSEGDVVYVNGEVIEPELGTVTNSYLVYGAHIIGTDPLIDKIHLSLNFFEGDGTEGCYFNNLGIFIDGGTLSTLIFNPFEVLNCRLDGDDIALRGIQIDHKHDTKIACNTFINFVGDAIYSSGSGGSTYGDLIFVGNSFDNVGGIFLDFHNGTADKFHFYNNAIDGIESGCMVKIDLTDITIGEFIHSHNRSTYGYEYLLDTVPIPLSSSELVENPDFIGGSPDPLLINSDSPCYHTGRLFEDSVLAIDIIGNSYYLPPSIGAYEPDIPDGEPDGDHDSGCLIGAIRIILDQRYTQDVDIGLYTPVAGNSEFRFSEAQLFGVSKTYNYEMILRDGIGDISSSFDDSIGGNNETINDFSFSIKGTNQFFIRISELSIQLSGKTIEYIEFEGTDIDSDSIAETVMFTGTIEDYEYNEFECRITAKSSFVNKRNKCLAQRASTSNYPDISDEMKDNMVPLTFGRSDPDNGRFFKLPRIEYRNELITNNELLGGYDEPKYMSSFPAAETSTVPSTHLPANKIRLLLTDDGTEDGYNAKSTYDIAGKYIKITAADVTQETCVGVIRKIDDLLLDPVYDGGPDYSQIIMLLSLTEYMPYEIMGHSLNVPGDIFRAFVNVIDILTKYILDYVDCECFISGNDFYTIDDDEMVKVVDVGTGQEVSTVPIYEVSASVYDGDIGNTNSYKILPVESIELYSLPDEDLGEKWELGGTGYYHLHDDYGQDTVGLFVQNGSFVVCHDQISVTGDGNYKDKDYNTSCSYDVSLGLAGEPGHYDYYMALKITLPEIEDTIKFDKMYLGIKGESVVTVDTGEINFNQNKFIVMKRGYYNKITELINVEDTINWEGTVKIDSLPDEYYSNSPNTDNKDFYYNEKTMFSLSGYQQFEMDISDINEYRNIHELIVLFFRHTDEPDSSPVIIEDTITISEMAIIFEKNITTGTELYA